MMNVVNVKAETYRNVRLSLSNIEFLNSISHKDETYDKILSKLISICKPILKQGGIRD